MPIDFSSWIKALKLQPKYLLPIAIFTGLTLFSPVCFLNKLGIQEFINKYRFGFGIAFLASSIILLSHAFIWIIGTILIRINLRVIRRRGIIKIHKLPPDAIKLISYYIINNTLTQKLDIRDGTVNHLIQVNILNVASNLGYDEAGLIFPVNIQPWAWDYLNEHKEVLSLIKR